MAQTIGVSSGQDRWRNYHPHIADPHVLLVEGNRMERAHHRKLLEICSYRVTEVNDVPAALAMLRAKKESFYFVIADASVPEANTCLFIETLKRDKLPIIYMANELNASIMEGANNMGACLLLEKPLHLSTVKTLWFSVEREKKSQLKVGRLVAAYAALTMKNKKLELQVKEATALSRGNAVNDRTNEVYETSAGTGNSPGLNQWPQDKSACNIYSEPESDGLTKEKKICTGQGENESHQLASMGITSSSKDTKRKFGEQAFVSDTQNQQTDWAVGTGHQTGVSDQYASKRYQKDTGKGKAVENHAVIYDRDNYSDLPEQISMQNQLAHQRRLLMANARYDPFELGNSSRSTVLGMRKTSITQESTEIYQQQRSGTTSSLQFGRVELYPQSNGDNQPISTVSGGIQAGHSDYLAPLAEIDFSDFPNNLDGFEKQTMTQVHAMTGLCGYSRGSSEAGQQQPLQDTPSMASISHDQLFPILTWKGYSPKHQIVSSGNTSAIASDNRHNPSIFTLGSPEATMEPEMFPTPNGLNSRATTASGSFNQHEMLPHFTGQPCPQVQMTALDEQTGNSMHHSSHHYSETNAAAEMNIMNWQENSNHMQGLYPPMIEMQMMEPNRSATNDAGNGGSSSTNECLNQMRRLADVPPQSGVFHSAAVNHGDPSCSNLNSMTDATAVSSSEQMCHDIGEWFSGLDQQDIEFLMSIVEPPPQKL